MKNSKTGLTLISALALTLAMFAPSHAASHGGAPKDTPDVKKEMPAAETAELTEGEIRKVDLDNKKITIKHGTIKNLDMPGMTMVFQVKDPAMVDRVKPGDKVRFAAEKRNGAIVVTDIQVTK